MNEHRQQSRCGNLRLLCAGALGVALAGCMTTRVEESKNSKTGIADHESVVILEASYHNGNETEDDFVDCIAKTVQKGRNGLRVIPEDEFIDSMFPWFEPRTMPQGPESLPALFEKPGVDARMKENGVRYIIWVTGDTERSASGGSLSCAVAPGGGGCFGLAWWENDSSYEAAIWDIRDGKSAGAVSADVKGTSVIPAVIVPVPLIARTRSAACKGLARNLREFIVDSGHL
ncbi:MAG: hypothetical protein KJO76_05490 [Gammaproteobacteria bacterium]|nr:hypothetical protein [Gammaproteobacteria bacterium]